MKVAILTFHRAINYGAILQAYALKRKIDELGSEANIVDYSSAKIDNAYKLLDWRFWHIKMFVALVIKFFWGKSKKDKFHVFREKYLGLTCVAINKIELEKLNNIYDCFVVGSDQVWNCNITGFDKTYLLDFVKDVKKKNSYAASFGFAKIDDQYSLEYKSLLENFNIITVREKQGSNIIKKLCCREAAVVLDPTLLLDKSEWSKIGNGLREEKYILIYLIGESENVYRIAENMATATGYKIINIAQGLRKKLNAEYVRTAGPEEFIGLFMNAQYILTNSFHGTAFSINFNKKFFTELSLGDSKKMNSRLENILDVFGLRDRQIVNGMNNFLYEEIDYERVNQILNRERIQSVKHLNTIISGNDE